jgi:alpha-N-arabinofuranosidase
VPPAKQVPVLFFSATGASGGKGTVYLKIVNASGTAQPLHIELKGAPTVSPEGTSVVLKSANPADTNTITDPMKIVPITSKISGIGPAFDTTVAPYSVNVIEIGAE